MVLSHGLCTFKLLYSLIASYPGMCVFFFFFEELLACSTPQTQAICLPALRSCVGFLHLDLKNCGGIICQSTIYWLLLFYGEVRCG